MKAGICIGMFLVGIVLSINEGPSLLVNVLGLAFLAGCAVLSNIWSIE